ncbi:hypothetical protein FB004_103169 [Sinorhizobium medicae]|nr:hypothetical protein FB004_103169 [Sinorhizobium medicae]
MWDGSWSTKTTVPGVLAAGNVIDPVFRQSALQAWEAWRPWKPRNSWPSIHPIRASGRSRRLKRRWLERKCGKSLDHAPPP